VLKPRAPMRIRGSNFRLIALREPEAGKLLTIRRLFDAAAGAAMQVGLDLQP
jgi:hypothetical protein